MGKFQKHWITFKYGRESTKYNSTAVVKVSSQRSVHKFYCLPLYSCSYSRFLCSSACWGKTLALRTDPNGLLSDPVNGEALKTSVEKSDGEQNSHLHGWTVLPRISGCSHLKRHPSKITYDGIRWESVETLCTVGLLLFVTFAGQMVGISVR